MFYHSFADIYRQVANIRRTLVGQWNCRSLRCSWSITCRRCSNYVFILDLTPASLDWAMTTAIRDEKQLTLGIWASYIRDFTVLMSMVTLTWIFMFIQLKTCIGCCFVCPFNGTHLLIVQWLEGILLIVKQEECEELSRTVWVVSRILLACSLLPKIYDIFSTCCQKMKAKQQNLSSPVNTNTPPSYATKKHNDGNKHIRTIEMQIIYIIYIYIYMRNLHGSTL